MRLVSSARRFDISPASFSWVGGTPAPELVEEIGVAAVGVHNVALTWCDHHPIRYETVPYRISRD